MPYGYGGGGGFAGPDRSYQPLPFSETVGGLMEREVRARELAAPVRFDMSSLDRQDQQDATNARLAMTPGVQQPGDAWLSPNASLSDALAAAVKPRTFSQYGTQYRFDPRLALGHQAAAEEVNYQLADADTQRRVGISQAADDARVQRLVAAGYPKKIAVRQVFGGGATPEEQKDLYESKFADTLQRDQYLQGELTKRAQMAEQARADLAEELQAAKSGDRQAAQKLRASLQMLDMSRKEHDQLMRQQQQIRLPGSTPPTPPPEDEVTRQARAHVQSLIDDSQDQYNTAAGVAATGAVTGRGMGSGTVPGYMAPMSRDEIRSALGQSVAASPASAAAPAPTVPAASVAASAPRLVLGAAGVASAPAQPGRWQRFRHAIADAVGPSGSPAPVAPGGGEANDPLYLDAVAKQRARGAAGAGGGRPSPADRWEELRKQGLSAAAATAIVQKEYGGSR